MQTTNVGWVCKCSAATHFHHPQTHRVVLVADADRGELIGDRAVHWLNPRDQGLVALELRDHALRVGGRLERPVDAAFHDPVAVHVYNAHGGVEEALFNWGVSGEVVAF